MRAYKARNLGRLALSAVGLVAAIAFAVILTGRLATDDLGLSDATEPVSMQTAIDQQASGTGPTDTPVGFGSRLMTEEEALNHVRQIVPSEIVWEYSVARLVEMNTFNEFTNHIVESPEPQSNVVWVVGFRSANPFSSDALSVAGGLMPPGTPELTPSAGSPTEAYVMIDATNGAVAGFGTINPPNIVAGPHSLNEIATMPEYDSP